MARVEVKVVGWDQKCSFSMYGNLGSDSLGRFVAVDTDKFYFPDDALLWVREFPQAPPTPDPTQEVVAEVQAPVVSSPKKTSRAHELAVLARQLREKSLKGQKAATRSPRKKKESPPTESAT